MRRKTGRRRKGETSGRKGEGGGRGRTKQNESLE